MNSYNHNPDTGELEIFSMCSSDCLLLRAEGVDNEMATVLIDAIREAEEIAFRAGQDHVRELMENALDEVGRKVLAQDYSETCRQKPTEAPQNRRRGKSSTFR